MWRTPAAARELLLASAALLCAASATAWSGSGLEAWLAGFAALGLAVTQALQRRIDQHLGRLHAACTWLPLPPPTCWAGWRRLAAMLPMAMGLLALVPAACQQAVRPAALTAYCMACLAGTGLQVAKRPGPRTASGQLLTLLAMVGLALQVARS